MKNNRRQRLTDISVISIMTALIAVSAQITVPLPSGVPVTLQTLTVALCGYFLKTGKSLISVIVYILLGLVGIPVFSSFNAGTAALFGKTGGFIIGFIFLVLACGTASGLKGKTAKILIGTAGLIICHAFGTMWFAFLTHTDFIASALLVSVPFLFKDFLCIICAYFLSERLNNIYTKL
ncbi:MAG: biotin transporter BioY [Clostridia bacterium]|nr:biotin transporter BioY [Clostridia bacterium]